MKISRSLLRQSALLGAAAAVVVAAGSASATPLRLEYTVTDIGGGTFQYDFTLILDNNDNSWAPGQGWRWFIFGDCVGPCTSPLTAFVGDPSFLPVGPWTGYSSSGGGHNGPTFSSVLDYWTPTAVGEQLTWRGTSTADLQEPDLKFSTLAGTLGGGIAADFEMAHRVGGHAPCYANCDESSIPPVLNVSDFICFQTKYAAGDPYANCDGSTIAPILNVSDFICFQTKYSAGCE